MSLGFAYIFLPKNESRHFSSQSHIIFFKYNLKRERIPEIVFGDGLGFFIIRFDVVFEADQIAVDSTEQEVWSVEENGQSSNQEGEILVL